MSFENTIRDLQGNIVDLATLDNESSLTSPLVRPYLVFQEPAESTYQIIQQSSGLLGPSHHGNNLRARGFISNPLSDFYPGSAQLQYYRWASLSVQVSIFSVDPGFSEPVYFNFHDMLRSIKVTTIDGPSLLLNNNGEYWIPDQGCVSPIC